MGRILLGLILVSWRGFFRWHPKRKLIDRLLPLDTRIETMIGAGLLFGVGSLVLIVLAAQSGWQWVVSGFDLPSFKSGRAAHIGSSRRTITRFQR